MVPAEFQHLFSLVAAQQLFYGLAWLLAVLLLPAQRRMATHWLGFCMLSALSLGLMMSRGRWPLWLGVGVADWLLVAALALAMRGAERFFHLPDRDREHLAALVCMALVLAATGAGVAGSGLRVPLLTLLLGGMLLRCVLRVHRPLQQEFGQRVAWLIHLPALLVVLACWVRSVWALGQPLEALNFDAQFRLAPSQAHALGVAMLAALAGVHFGYGGLLVARLSRRLMHLSRHDALTGLLNRRAMLDGLQQEWQRWLRQGGSFHLLMLDLDHFKNVNDRYGHAAGDQALVAVAEVLRQALRPTDLAARMGGEEFLVMLPGADEEAAEGVAQRLCGLIAQSPLHCAAGAFRVTTSIGLSGVRPGDICAEAVMERADHALYHAKQAGRDRYMRARA